MSFFSGHFKYAAILVADTAISAGCAVSSFQLPETLSRAPQVSAAQIRKPRQSAKSGDLLYVSADDATVLMFSYPALKLLGSIADLPANPVGLCSDNKGDVFVTLEQSLSQSYIFRYAHGGTQPIATLSDPGLVNSCAVDPSSGNLAVTNFFNAGESQYEGDLLVYKKARGTPATYYPPETAGYCTALTTKAVTFSQAILSAAFSSCRMVQASFP